MTLTPEALTEAVARGDRRTVVRHCHGATEAERKACLPAVKKQAAQRRRDNVLFTRGDHHDCLGLALAACTSGAAAVATHLHKWWAWRFPDELVALLCERDVPWLPDVVTRLSDLGDRDRPAAWDLVEELRVSLGLPRPESEMYLRGLVLRIGNHGWTAQASPRRTILDQLRADPGLLRLVPAMLRAEGIAPWLAVDADRDYDPATRLPREVPRVAGDSWPSALAELCREGRLARSDVAAACLGMLLRADTPAKAGGFVRVLEAVEVDDDAVLANLRVHTQLLADGSGPAARYAQARLRALDDAGRLELDELLAASAAALARPDKGVVVAQLGWLDRVARREPDRRDEVVLVVAEGFGHERADVQERALRVVGKHLAGLGEGTLEELRLLAESLSPALRAEAGRVLGGSGAAGSSTGAPEPEASTHPVLPAVPADLRADGPEPVTTPHELAETISTLLESPQDALVLERVLDGLARLAGTDGFWTGVEPVVGRVEKAVVSSWASVSIWDREPGGMLAEAALHAVFQGYAERRPSRVGRVLRRAKQSITPPRPLCSPTGLLLERLRELATRLGPADGGPLLSFPTAHTGHVDPAALLERLDRWHALGRAPWPIDLQQALLRLPRDIGAEHVAAAERLRSPAGRVVAERLRRGPEPDPASRRVTGDLPIWVWQGLGVSRVPLAPAAMVALASRTTPDRAWLASLAWWLPDPFASRRQIRAEIEGPYHQHWLPALPSHREVVAAHALRELRWIVDGSSMGMLTQHTRDLLVGLPRATGPVGPAVVLAVTYAMGAERPVDRTAALDALVGFAVTGDLPGAALGTELAELQAMGVVKLGRAAGVLADLGRSGPAAARLAWDVVSAALPPLLAGRVRDTHLLLAVAADAVATTGARGEVAGLAEVADAKGGSRLVTEAARLQRLLAP